jgi:hypothetical protein
MSSNSNETVADDHVGVLSTNVLTCWRDTVVCLINYGNLYLALHCSVSQKPVSNSETPLQLGSRPYHVHCVAFKTIHPLTCDFWCRAARQWCHVHFPGVV